MARIAVLTIGTGEYCERILQGLANVQLVPDALCLTSRRKQPFHKHIRHPHKIITQWLLKSTKAVAPKILGTAPSIDPMQHWQGCAKEIRYFDTPNSRPLVSFLQALQPDYLILAGSGIVKDEVLSIPKQGTLNVHPGLIPWIRGVGVVERALEREVPVGITAHFVDVGIDTGAIIRRELIHVHSQDTLNSLRRRAEYRCAQVMVDLVLDANQGKEFKALTQKERYPYCHWPSPEEKAKVEAAVQNGLALKLYKEWKTFFGSHILPNEHVKHPPVKMPSLNTNDSK